MTTAGVPGPHRRRGPWRPAPPHGAGAAAPGAPRPFGRSREMDRTIFAVTVILLALGIAMVFSASFAKAMDDAGDPFYFLKRQLLWALVGVPVMWLFSHIEYPHWRQMARPALYSTLVLLVAVLLIGAARGGAERWIDFGFFSFQPSEWAKFALCIFFADHFTRVGPQVRDFRRGLGPWLLVVATVSGLIMLQPDLGTTVAIGGMAVLMAFLAGARIQHLLALGALAVPALIVAITQSEYRWRRITAFLDPWADPQGTGYHLIQGLLALGSGGWFGLGFGLSRQKIWYLPEQHTDFIFAVLGEELGLLGTLTVLALYAVLIWRGFRTAATAPDTFGALLAAGITSIIAIQVVVNIGVVTATLPITGITLPLLSYGGSSLVVTLAAIGILINVSRHCPQ